MQCARPAGVLAPRGFTLIELLVVLVIAAIAVAVVGVSAQTYMERARYHQTVLDVATQLERARAMASQEGRSVVVSYEPPARQLAIDGQPVLEIVPALRIQWKALEHAPAGRAASGEPIFVFDADGRVRGGPMQISRGAQGVRFEVNWLLATVRQTAVLAP
jgi:general secretion pathway protein H